jgi:hypothetical protein
MSYNPHKDPVPPWFPGLLIGVAVAGFIVYQMLS